MQTVEERVNEVRARMAKACEKAGRTVDSVQLVAVSKTFPPERVSEVAACGIEVFGENRVQEAAQKIPQCSSRLRWHLVGHLQSNKVRHAVPLFDVIHSVDSIKLLRQVDAGCADAGKRMPVLIEVNVAGEASKFGLKPDDVAPLLEAAASCAHAEVCGLMTVPPFTPDAASAAPFFRQLRELRDRCERESGRALPELSMGMSHDFEVAIAEGATWIRVGSALFGERT